MLLPTLQSVARRLGQGELYEGIALDTDPLVMPKFASEIEVRAKQVGFFLFSFTLCVCVLFVYLSTSFAGILNCTVYMVLCINQFAKTVNMLIR